ncbi:MAG TPA: tyrosine-type recombinase/integrase [Thermohalobaculum sp.]|nr:tyrosine-type recombinase/integrase [Thermohalobaculum sp.]
MLSLDEVRSIWQATYAVGDLSGAFLRILILTAQRRGNVAGARWSEVELDARRWAIPGERTKNGKPHIVHLSDPALAEFKALRERTVDGAGLIFTTTGTTPISGFGRLRDRREIEAAIERINFVLDERRPMPK